MPEPRPPSPPRASRRTPGNPRLRLLFLTLLGCWMLFPFLQGDLLAEDAVPFVAVARVDVGQRGTVYSVTGGEAPPPAITAAGCPLAPPGTDCETHVLAFLSPPQVIPVMKVVSALGDTASVLLLRLVAVASLAGGLVVLWARVAKDDPAAQLPLLVAAVLLTPFAYTSAVFGQSSPLLFLSACLGLTRTDRTDRAVGAAAVFVGTVVFKLFPLPLLLVAAVRRRWRFVAAALGLLVALTIVTALLVPLSQYGEFVDSTRALTAQRVAYPWNISLDAFVHGAVGSWRTDGAVFLLSVVARVGAVVALAWWRLRDEDDDVIWSYGWVALLVINPQIWWHYFAVLVPAVAYLVRRSGGRTPWSITAAAAAVLPLAVVTDEGALRVYGPVLALVAVIGLPFLAGRGAPGRGAAVVEPRRPAVA